MNKDKQALGYLHMEDDRLYFCIIPLLKRHAAQVKFLVQEEGGGTNEKNEGINNTTNSSNFRNSGRGIKRGNNKLKVNIDFYFRLGMRTIRIIVRTNWSAEILNGYEVFAKI